MASPEQLRRFGDWAASQLGLHFPENRWPELDAGLARTAESCGFPDTEAFLDRLEAFPSGPGTIAAAARHLTVGETYFFREEKSFQALEATVLPALIRARGAAGKKLRIWCAGCCTGEEPYSLAILLDRLLPDREWTFSLLATDINPAFLAKASQGVYGNWSFRETPAWIKRKYFRARPDGLWEVRTDLKSRIDFRSFNLAGPYLPIGAPFASPPAQPIGSGPHPSAPLADGPFDLILCRNVLMYFTPTAAEAAIFRFALLLSDDGWLGVSPTEGSPAFAPWFAPANLPGTLFYRKKPAAPPLPQPAAPERAVDSPPARKGPYPTVRIPVASAPQVSAAEPARAQIRMARSFADAGRLDEALACCRKAAEEHGPDAGLLYLEAAIREGLGDDAGATAALDRALYLKPDFALAHFALGSLALRSGSRGHAARHFRNALALLEDRPEAPVTESGGIPSPALQDMIRKTLSQIADGGR